MNENLQVTGLVISVMPIGEHDRRILLLTAEMGKISAFIRGARRGGSPLMAAGRAFAFGRYELYPGRSAYTVKSADIQEYFDFLSMDPEAFCYASYFAELAAWYSRENMEDAPLLRLLLRAIQALGKEKLNRALVRYAYELKLLQTEGEAMEEPPLEVDASAYKAWHFVLENQSDQCFNFLLEPTSFRSFSQAVAALRNQFIDGRFKSLKVLEELQAANPIYNSESTPPVSPAPGTP